MPKTLESLTLFGTSSSSTSQARSATTSRRHSKSSRWTTSVVLQLPCWCGPATLAMMLSQFDIDVDQQTVGKYADASNHMEELGTRPDELALAVRRINPELRLWAKRDASLEDIDVLINKYKIAV